MIPLIFICLAASAVDGDTLRCADIGPKGTYRVRLAAIDAPELPGHCRPAGRLDEQGNRNPRDCAPGDGDLSRIVLARLIIDKQVQCRVVDANPWRKGFQPLDPYRRPVARCSVDGKDLSDTMLRLQLARPWP
jgi:micrococcal nuclease